MPSQNDEWHNYASSSSSIPTSDLHRFGRLLPVRVEADCVATGSQVDGLGVNRPEAARCTTPALSPRAWG